MCTQIQRSESLVLLLSPALSPALLSPAMLSPHPRSARLGLTGNLGQRGTRLIHTHRFRRHGLRRRVRHLARRRERKVNRLSICLTRALHRRQLRRQLRRRRLHRRQLLGQRNADPLVLV